MPPGVYDRALDDRLTKTEARTGIIGRADARTSPRKNALRVVSRRTLAGHSTGFHEAAVTTDSFDFLRKATDNGNGKHSLPMSSSGSYFRRYKGQEVYSASLEWVLEAAHPYRMDTAGAIITAPLGQAAGHSGSGVSTKGQAGAHNLLRESVMKVLQTDPATKPGITKASINAFFSALMVNSRAPGTLARPVMNSRSLKHRSAATTWEADREEAKLRVDAVSDMLPTNAERAFVVEAISHYLTRAQEGATSRGQGDKRVLSILGGRPRARSRERDISQSPDGHPLTGREYVAFEQVGRRPTLAPPPKLEDWGHYISQTMKAPVRKVSAAGKRSHSDSSLGVSRKRSKLSPADDED